MQNASAPSIAPENKLAVSSRSEIQRGPLAIVGGCGHVGLPLGLAFARLGFQVDLVDSSPERVALVNSGRMPFHEDDAEVLLTESVAKGLVKATCDEAVLEDAA